METAQGQKIYDRMFHSRLDPEKFKTWKHCDTWDIRPRKIRDVIEEKLAAGFRVTSGYMTTSCRGYHTHYLLWK